MTGKKENIIDNSSKQPKRKLEYFEDMLKTSVRGREVITLFQKHFEEIFYLINHNRSVGVTWQRNQGPAFIRSVVDSGFDENSKIPKYINGIGIEKLLLKMISVLQQKGSYELRMAIADYAYQLLYLLRNYDSLMLVIKEFNSDNLQNSKVVDLKGQYN